MIVTSRYACLFDPMATCAFDAEEITSPGLVSAARPPWTELEHDFRDGLAPAIEGAARTGT